MNRTRTPRATFSRRFPRALVLAFAVAIAHGIFVSRLALAHGIVHERIAELSAEIARHPADAALYLERAELSRVDGAPDSALADLDRAARLDPRMPRTDLCRGATLLALSRAAEAERALSRFLAVVPNECEALRLRARAFAALGRPLEGAADLAIAIAGARRVTPDDFLERARMLRASDGPGALAVLEAGMTRLGPAASLELEALDLEVALGRTEPALERLDRMKPWLASEAWRAWRAEVFAAAGRAMDARAEYSGALEAIEALLGRRREAPATRAIEARVREALRVLDKGGSR